MGSTFGKRNSGASTVNDSGVSVPDPQMGLNDDQVRNRKLAAMGGGLVGRMMQPQGVDQPAGQPTNFNFAQNQPQFQQPQTPAMADYVKKPKNPFFGAGY